MLAVTCGVAVTVVDVLLLLTLGVDWFVMFGVGGWIELGVD